MKTPNNEAGRTTDAIMSEVRAQLPELPTSQFNTIWEAVYKVLSGQGDGNPYKQLSDLMAKSTFRGFSIDC